MSTAQISRSLVHSLARSLAAPLAALAAAAVTVAAPAPARADHWRHEHREIADWFATADPLADPMAPRAMPLAYQGGELPLAAGAPACTGLGAGGAHGLGLPPLEPAAKPPPRARRYPREVIDRPALVPFGVVVATGDLDGGGTAGGLGASAAATAGLPLGLEVGLAYRRAAGAAGDRTTASAGMRLLGAGPLVVSAHAAVERDAAASAPVDRALAGVRIAATLGRAAVWLRPTQLSVDLRGEAPARLVAPISVGLQLAPSVWAHADADLTVAELRDRMLVRTRPASVPAALGAVVSLSSSLDLRLRLSGDLDGSALPRAAAWLVGLGWNLGG